jgi:chromosome segregation ATPase
MHAFLRAKDEVIQALQEELEKEKASREAAVNGVHTAVKATMDLLNRAVQEKTNEAIGLQHQVSQLKSQLHDEKQVAGQWKKVAEGLEQTKHRDRGRIRELEDLLERAERKLKDLRRR